MRVNPGSSAIVLTVALALMSAGCDAVGDPEGEGEEATTDEIESDTAIAETMRLDCTVGCPPGWHATSYYCSTCGGNVLCTASYNSTVCEKDVLPDFNKCGIGCPSGYHMGLTSCEQKCVGSSGVICSSFTGDNASYCAAIVTIDAITDPQNGSNIRVGQPISIWGTNFNPNASVVKFTWFVPNTNVKIERTMEAGSDFWWNGDTKQINTIVPADMIPDWTFAVQVGTSAWWSEPKKISAKP
jgi:hypothetical protein